MNCNHQIFVKLSPRADVIKLFTILIYKFWHQTTNRSICPRRAKSSACGSGRSPPEGSTFKVPHSRVGSWPHPKPGRKSCQRQTLQLTTQIGKL